MTETHRALIPTCRHSLKVKVLLGDVIARAKLSVSLSSCLACTANAGYIVRISSAANLITILTNFGGYKTLRSRLDQLQGMRFDAYGGYHYATPPPNHSRVTGVLL